MRALRMSSLTGVRRRLMSSSPGPVVEGNVIGWTALGEAVADVGAERVLVPGAIEGERVRCRVVDAGYSDRTWHGPRAELLEVVSVDAAAARRVDPFCKHHAVCRGCPWQMVDAEDQLRLKSLRVQRTALEACGDAAGDVVVGTPVASPSSTGYRRSMTLHFGENHVLGYVNASDAGSRVWEVEECGVMMQHELVREAVSLTKGWWRNMNDPNVRLDLLKVAVSGSCPGEMLLLLHLTPAVRGRGLAKKYESQLASQVRSRLGFPASVEVVVPGSRRTGGYREFEEVKLLAGTGSVTERVRRRVDGDWTSDAATFQVGSRSFWHPNTAVAEIMFNTMLDWVCPINPSTIVDAFSGVGVCAVLLAKHLPDARAVGVEVWDPAVRDADYNAAANGVADRVEFVGSTAAAAVPVLRAKLRAMSAVGSASSDLLVAFPPADGMSSNAQALLALRPQHVLTSACSLSSLRADVAALAGAGYALRRLQTFDMWPHVAQAQALCLFERVAPLRFVPADE
eukprot:TRINITY_DN11796_c0_g1_i1.p1 TRINITY_DN11796_c0_g1~~TRINITY_DN11796_c0_g1_i1.p1  ORF type:complete len:512 (+),score=153.08 TRINITY_DN11796_c0_g1_i1:69-1604(+)